MVEMVGARSDFCQSYLFVFKNTKEEFGKGS